jgi:hypothetical protein
MVEINKEYRDHGPQASLDRHESGMSAEELKDAKKEAEHPFWIPQYSIDSIGEFITITLVMYLLSSGPVMAIAFWLRDRTDWDGFYSITWIYYPLLVGFPLAYPFQLYLEWWCRLFGTMPPG